MNIRNYFSKTQNAKLKRYQKMVELSGLKPEHRVLHAGCGHGYSFEFYNKENEVVGLDIFPPEDCDIVREKFRYVQGDGTHMDMFKDKEFDLVVNVGTLEHIRPYEKLQAFANEIRRVGKGYVVIVPHFWTPIEPHYQLPFWQVYPIWFKKWLSKRWSIGNYPKGEFEDLQYFNKAGWLKLFPDAKIYDYNHIRFGIVKNFIIYKPIGSEPQ
jgi:ubiquinone/menaquinone biosynthesis C-methylase UbiE